MGKGRFRFVTVAVGILVLLGPLAHAMEWREAKIAAEESRDPAFQDLEAKYFVSDEDDPLVLRINQTAAVNQNFLWTLFLDSRGLLQWGSVRFLGNTGEALVFSVRTFTVDLSLAAVRDNLMEYRSRGRWVAFGDYAWVSGRISSEKIRDIERTAYVKQTSTTSRLALSLGGFDGEIGVTYSEADGKARVKPIPS